MREVAQLLDQSQNLDDVSDMNVRLLEMALTCHGTFEVERCDAPEVFGSYENLAIYIECSVMVHDHSLAVEDKLPEPIQTLLHLFAKRAHVLERYVRHSCLMNQQCLHDTVHRIWSGYRSNGVWSALPAPDERWVVTTTQSEKAYSPMTVHYNILDGSLLVNGLSLTRLPRSYQLHATYRRLFGDVCNPVILVLRGTMLMIST